MLLQELKKGICGCEMVLAVFGLRCSSTLLPSTATRSGCFQFGEWTCFSLSSLSSLRCHAKRPLSGIRESDEQFLSFGEPFGQFSSSQCSYKGQYELVGLSEV